MDVRRERQRISGLKLVVGGGGTPSLQVVWSHAGPGLGGTSPIVANGVLYYAGSGGIRALNPVSGSELWRDASIGAIHWESPIVANGTLYVTDESGQLTAYVPWQFRAYLPLAAS